MNNSIYPCIWCNNNAAEVPGFYESVFPDTKITDKSPLVMEELMKMRKVDIRRLQQAAELK